MNYEVTATRKRPRTFDELAGQEFVVSTLKNALASGRIAHAYLFSGPRGVGKTSAARILAKALNCPSGATAEPCDDYPGSEEIARGTSMDVIEIDGASNTSVNDVREIKDEVLFAPNSSRYKIYIIDEVHMLSNSAFNALLKTIEEPPPYIVFIFATTEIHKVPATIRSRCQQFNFRLIPQENIRELLSEACSESDITADDEALHWMSKEAKGSLRDAYTLFDQVASFSEGRITFDKIQDKLGVSGLDQLNAMGEAFCDGDAGKALALAEETLDAGVPVEQLVIELSEYFRNLLFLKQDVRKESILGYNPDRFSAHVVATLSDTQIQRGLDLLLELYRNIRYSLDQRYELELVVSRLAMLRDFLTSREILSAIQRLRGQISAGELESPQDAGGERVQVAGTPLGLEEEKAEEIVSLVRKQKLTLGSALEKAVSWTLDDSALCVTFENAYPADAVRQELALVTEAARSALDEAALTVKVAVEKSEDESEGHHDEQVEMVRKVFRGEIVDR